MQLDELIEKTVLGLGYVLVELERSPRARLLRVFIDHPEGSRPEAGGVSIDDCTLVSNQLTRVFMVENVDYDRLEVSSPGLDRPLNKVADYHRFVGSEVQLKLRMPVGNQRNFRGVLEGIVGEPGMEKACLRAEDALHELALENIDRARLVPKF